MKLWDMLDVRSVIRIENRIIGFGKIDESSRTNKEKNMRQVLTENAFEAWAAAIRFCDDIKNGKVSLQYQKNFVSSLHNAVELIMKQMMLNNNDHRVAEIRKVNNEEEAKLLLDYFKASDLNIFFDRLSSEQLSKFGTIQFNELIMLHRKLFGSSLADNETLKTELQLLQKLRNNETHFLIRQGSFLSEGEFCILHNFMIRFYRIMETWHPINKDDYELYILPYWGDPVGADSVYGFEREPLQSFSYELAVRNSDLAKEIAELLTGEWRYGAPDFSPYSITKELVDENPHYSHRFDEIWSMIFVMQGFGIIVVDEVFDDEQGRVYYDVNVLL